MEDYICAMGMHRYGYGFWDLIKNDIRNEPSLVFDWIARSRTVADIQKRCDLLISQFEKEYDPDVDRKKAEKKGKKVVTKTQKPQEAKKTLGKRKHEESSDEVSEGDKPNRGRPRRVVAK